MAEQDASSDDKQLPATERRLRKAAEEGQVARSRDMTHAAVMIAGIGGFGVFGPSLGTDAIALLRDGLRFTPSQLRDPTWMARRLGELAQAGFDAVLPMLVLLSIALAVAAAIPGGVLLVTRPITPDLSRLDPKAGLSRIFSKDALINLVKLVAIAAALATVGWFVVIDRIPQFAHLADLPLVVALQTGMSSLFGGLAAMGAVLVVTAAIDVPLQMFRHRSRLKMTHQEVREEGKETEGNPQMRARVRQRQREIGRTRMLAAVPKADVVITNPTHYAVAIRYEELSMGAPRVVAKGADHLAHKIRAIALENRVTIVELPPLARALHAHVELDHEVPPALYSAVAQVLAYVYQLRRFVPGRGRMPAAPSQVEMPSELDPQHEASQDAGAGQAGAPSTENDR